MFKGTVIQADLRRLRELACKCDDGSLCCNFQDQGLSRDCKDCCPGFVNMWGELLKLLGVS